MMMHAVGLRLGKTLAEISEMTVEEYRGWIAFLAVLDEESR